MKQLERLFDLSLDMLCVAGFDGHFKRVNPAFTHVLGYDEAELLARPFLSFVHPDDRRPSTDAMARLIEGLPVLDFENRYFCADGSVRWLSWRASSVPEAGEIYAVARDVTEKRRLTQLFESAEILRSVTVGTAATVGSDYFRSLVRHLADALGVRYCILTECREERPSRARTVAFWDGEEFKENIEYDIAGTPCEKVLAGQTCLWGERIQDLFPSDPDLRQLEVESYAAVPAYSSAGQVVGLLAVLDVKPFPEEEPDTSLLRIFADRAGAELERQRYEKERQKLQAQILHSQKLESLGVLAGGIAHDFNNILVGILGNSGLALKEIPSGSLARPFLERIEQAAERAADLANQMLAYSGKGQFVVESFHLKDVVEEMADLLRTSISKKADLRIRIGEEVPVVRADATQIRQLFLNLITNASDALGDDSGVISVDIDARDADDAFLAESYPGEDLSEGRYVYLEVTDSGCGMDEETRSKIFDPFFTTKRPGRGLGMAAVLGIVRGHHGAIRVASAPGNGSVFTVLFPASTSVPEPGREPAGDPRPESSHGCVLVIDDEEIVREVARLTLAGSGYEVRVGADGRQGLEIFRRDREKIVAVVLDLTMPRMSGEETLQALREISSDVRVVLTSGFTERDVASRLDGQGVAGFLKKPYRPGELLRMLDQVLRGPGRSTSR